MQQVCLTVTVHVLGGMLSHAAPAYVVQEVLPGAIATAAQTKRIL